MTSVVNLTRAAGEPLECSPVRLLLGRQHKAFLPAQLKCFEPSKTCLLAALLCNIILQYWWPLSFCLLKTSSHIWFKCTFSVLKHYGAGEWKSRVKQAVLHTDDVLQWVWSLQWVTETTGFCGQWGGERKLWSTLTTETASPKLSPAINMAWQNTEGS